MSVLIARVAVDKTLYSFDMAYDYIVPEYLRRKASVGKRILVPFGSGNKKRQGQRERERKRKRETESM